MKNTKNKKNMIIRSSLFVFFLSSIFYLLSSSICYGQDSGEFVNQGWSALGKINFEKVYQITDSCIQSFEAKAKKQAAQLDGFPAKGEEDNYKAMNHVATCYFIKGEAYMREDKNEKAIQTFQEAIDKYPYAQSFDPRGWYWSIKEKAQKSINKLITGKIEDEDEAEAIITQVELHDPGKDLPIDYEEFGEFKGIGTEDYEYIVEKPIELAEAAGEGVYPNTNSVNFDPRLQERPLGNIKFPGLKYSLL